MLVQIFINKNGIDALKEDPYFIDIKEYDNGLVVLNYNMINSKKFNPIVNECRGLILDSKNEYKIVAKSFNRFYNYEECPFRKTVDFSDAIVQEKIDGSLCTVYFHNGKWNVSTRKMAFAEGLNYFNNSFQDTFERACSLYNFEKLNFDKDLNFVFELVSPETRIVTRYSDFEVYLLTITRKGIEFSQKRINEYANDLKVKRPKTYKVNSLNDIKRMIKELPVLEEGYVCLWEKSFINYRLKIKNPSYLAIAHLREDGKISEKRVIILVTSGDEEEYLNYFPEDKIIFQPYINAFKKLKEQVNDLWNKYKDIKDQKEFALKVKDYESKSFLFSYRKRKTFEECLEKLTINSKINIIKSLMD